MNGPTLRHLTLAITLMTTCSAVTVSQPVYASSATVAGEQLFRQMRLHRIVKGRFEQWRNLTGIPRPIRSSGRFIFWRDHGLYWETREPIFQSTTFTPDAIIHWQSTAAMRQADRSSSPIQQRISRILLAVFGGDIQSLERLFKSRWSSGPKQWTVDLIPTARAIKRVIQKITLTGGNYVSSLSLGANNGDTTRIHFADISIFTNPATDDCQYFKLDPQLCSGDKDEALPSNRMEP